MTDLDPITTRFSFIKANPIEINNVLLKWLNPLLEKHSNKLVSNQIDLNLKDTFLSLCPLTTVEIRRYLILPTKSKWTAFLSNGHFGTDETAPKIIGSKLHCDIVYFSFDLKTKETVFNLYKRGELIRSIAAIKEGKWKLYEFGDYQSFENLEYCKEKIISNRFNPNILDEYLKKIGIYMYNESFYQPHNAFLIEKKGKKFEATEELTLFEANNFFKR